MFLKNEFIKTILCLLLCCSIVLFGIASGEGIAVTFHSKMSKLLFESESSSVVPVNKGNYNIDKNKSSVELNNKKEGESKLTQTPDDILKLKISAEEIYKKHKKNGEIVEKMMGATSITSKYGNVLVDNKTKEKADIKNNLKKTPEYGKITKSKPYILIYHTHTTEGYEMLDMGWYSNNMNSRTKDKSRNMVRVGDELAKTLEEAGFKVIHDRNIYDESYNGAYDRSRVSVKKYLEKYPTIAVTLDVHRDAIHYENKVKCKPTAVVNGKKAAQVMIITGCEGGKVESFPDWQKNLVFSTHLQKQVVESYGNVMRPLYFSYRKYNMDLTPCSVLLEFGTDANTLEEAVYSARLVGTALGEMLEKNMK